MLLVKEQRVDLSVVRVHRAEGLRVFGLQPLEELGGKERVARLRGMEAVRLLNQVHQRIASLLIVCDGWIQTGVLQLEVKSHNANEAFSADDGGPYR